uniref:Uncharacterized protein n=1 Tax=Setaria viridis TaxID=4556 RepID=A0A4U6VQJ2_SETVI|nr:hypothetical protein SEVIR_2G144901v2 [Setaria viridis]
MYASSPHSQKSTDIHRYTRRRRSVSVYTIGLQQSDSSELSHETGGDQDAGESEAGGGGLGSGGTGRGRRGRGIGAGSAGRGEGGGAGHDVDLELHAPGAVAGDTTDEVAHPRGGQGDGVVAGGVGDDGPGVGAVGGMP